MPAQTQTTTAAQPPVRQSVRVRRNRHRWEKQWAGHLLTASRVVLLLILALLPLAWGGRHPLALGLAGTALCLVFVLWSAGTLLEGSVRLYPAAGLLIFVPLIALGLLQMHPGFSDWAMTQSLRSLWSTVSSAADAVQGAARAAQLTGGTLSVTPVLAPMTDVQSMLILTLAVGALFYWLVCQLFGNARWLVAAALTVSAAAALIAAVGLTHRFGGVDWFVFFIKEPARWGIEGPYFNKNHFAQLMNMGFFVSLGLAMAFYRTLQQARRLRCADARNLPLYPLLYRLYGDTGSRLAAFFCSANALICAVALLLSYSRAGVLCGAAVLAMFVFYLLVQNLRERTQRSALSFSLPVLVVLAAVLLVSLYGLGRITQGLDLAVSGEDPSGLVRLQIWKTAMAVISLSPIVGTGLAGMRTWGSTFGESYTPGTIAFDAHNDYLDLVIAAGWPLALLIFAGLGFMLCRLVVRTQHPNVRRSSVHWIVIGAVAALLAAAGHEVFDYGLKQTANLCVFLMLCVIAHRLTVLCLQRNDASVPDSCTDRPAAVPELRGTRWLLGRPLYAVLVPVLIVAGFGVQHCLHAVRDGAALERFEVLAKSPDIRRALPAPLYQQHLIEQSREVPHGALAQRQSLQMQVNAWRALASLDRTEALASSVSRLLDRSVSSTQVNRAPYARYWPEAFARLTPEERAAVAQDHRRSAQAALQLWQLNPVNALALSVLAAEIDESAAWNQTAVTAAPLHQSAMALFGDHTTVLANTISGLWRAWQLESRPGQKAALFSRMQTAVQRIAVQSPQDLGWILPQLWTIDPSADRLRRLTPVSIQAQTKLGEFLGIVGQNAAAVQAYDTVLELNSLRPAEQTPESLGTIGYLRRERREPARVERDVLQAQIPLLNALNRTDEATALLARVEALLYAERTRVIERADALMEQGNYVLAEQVLKPVQSDPRALVRWARILVNGGRLEQYRRVMQELDARQSECDALTLAAFEQLREQTPPL